MSPTVIPTQIPQAPGGGTGSQTIPAPLNSIGGLLAATGTSIAFVSIFALGLIGAGFVLARKRRKVIS